MINENYNKIKKQEELIEEKRLKIKEEKKKITSLKSKLDLIGNLYEYLATPACAISIALVALTTGPIVYILPAITAVLALTVMANKFAIKNKIEKGNNLLSDLKEERKKAYKKREEIFENIFSKLQHTNMDVKDYYHQLVEAHKKCELLNEYMEPYKNKRTKLNKTKNIISGVFGYLLAPVAAVIMPLVCSFVDVGLVWEIAIMAMSSGTLLALALTDDHLTSKIDDLTEEIDDIKSDRTVAYVKRDIKLNEALEYLKTIDVNYRDIKLNNQVCRQNRPKEEKKMVKNR